MPWVLMTKAAMEPAKSSQARVGNRKKLALGSLRQPHSLISSDPAAKKVIIQNTRFRPKRQARNRKTGNST